MRISKYWFRTRKDGASHKTAIRKVDPRKGWSTQCECDVCNIKFNRTFESTRFNFDKCDKCAMSEMNKTMFTKEVKAKISKATSTWHANKENKIVHAKIVSDRYKDEEYAESHGLACQRRSADLEYRQKLSDNAARGKEHAIKTSCGLQKIKRSNFKGFVSTENIILRQKCKETVSKECLQKADFTCDKCNEKGGRLNAHHLNGWHWAIEERFELSNLVCLCHGCHSVFHKKYGNRNNTKDQYNEFNKNMEE